MKEAGKWWNDVGISLVEIEGIVYALHGFNGEAYYNCWRISGEHLTEASKEKYTLKPVYRELEDEEFEIIDYTVY